MSKRIGAFGVEIQAIPLESKLSLEDKKKIAGCYYSIFITGISVTLIGAILPLMAAEYELNYTALGIMLSMYSCGGLIAGFSASIIPRYIGRRNSTVLLCSMLFFGFAIMIFTKNQIVLTGAFFLAGIGMGATSNTNNTVVSVISDSRHGPLNILHSFFALGAFIGPVLALLITRHNEANWKVAIGTVCILSAVMVIVFFFMKYSDEPSGKQKITKGTFRFLRNPVFLVTAGILFSYSCSENVFKGWLVTYFKDSGIMKISYAQMLSSLLWLVIMIGRLFCAYLSRRVSKKKILVVATIGEAVFFVVMLVSRNLPVITVSMICMGFLMAGIYPTTVANLGGIVREEPMSLGFLMAVSGLGSIAMPLITGAVAEKAGIGGGMSLITVTVGLMVVFALINAKMKNQPV